MITFVRCISGDNYMSPGILAQLWVEEETKRKELEKKLRETLQANQVCWTVWNGAGQCEWLTSLSIFYAVIGCHDGLHYTMCSVQCAHKNWTVDSLICCIWKLVKTIKLQQTNIEHKRFIICTSP